MVKAWYMADVGTKDQRLPLHLEPDRPVNLETLSKIGVEHYFFPPETYEENSDFQKLKKEKGYSFQDVITVSQETLPNYEQKIKTFFKEHLHTDEEIRYAIEGSGYFDVRDSYDRWIRIELEKGDMILLPAGIYHRFTLDEKNYIKALRLFVGEPVWTPHNRPCDDMPARTKYVERFVECAK